jgi:hypothetical protein
MTGVDVGMLAQLTPDELAGLLDQLTGSERALIEQALLEAIAGLDPLAGLDWRQWNQACVPAYIQGDYAAEHEQFWEWVDQIGDARPDPWLSLWPRGYAKSALAEIATAKLLARGIRKYCLYVSHTQSQADDHVGNIGAILESDTFTRHYPAMGEVKLSKFGSSKGWRRNRLRTASGATIDALGLDASRRGARLDEQRPDMMVLDDIDDTHASAAVNAKNIRTITQALIPALLPNKVLILAQNVVAPNSIAAQLGAGVLDMMGGAIRSGPFPLVADMTAERRDGKWRITGGTPRWPAWMDLGRCEEQLRDMGMDAFVIECQQDTSERPGAIWRKEEISESRVDVDRVPELERVVVAVDPNKTGRSDDAGVVKIGRALIAGDYHAFVLADDSRLERPSEWRDSTARSALNEPKAGAVVVESAGLGEHAELTVKGSPLWGDYPIAVYEAKAKLGKKDRARPVWRLYKDRRVHHVGSLPYLERQMTTWEPDEDPMSPGALDALVHGITHLLIDVGGAPKVGWGA